MFDTGLMGAEVRVDALTQLHDAAERFAPVTLARERRLDVSDALAHLLPDGLQRGSILGVQGIGAMSLGLAVVAGPVLAGSWLATVGCEELCLVGAEQAGVALHRTVLVALPPKGSWGAVVAALVDAFEVVLVSGTYRAGARDARRLLTRARERGTVIVDVGGVWPEAHDIVLESTESVWSGIGSGYGTLTKRQIVVEVSGRRGVRSRQVPLWLPGQQAAPEAIEEGPKLRGLATHSSQSFEQVG